MHIGRDNAYQNEGNVLGSRGMTSTLIPHAFIFSLTPPLRFVALAAACRAAAHKVPLAYPTQRTRLVRVVTFDYTATVAKVLIHASSVALPDLHQYTIPAFDRSISMTISSVSPSSSFDRVVSPMPRGPPASASCHHHWSWNSSPHTLHRLSLNIRYCLHAWQ